MLGEKYYTVLVNGN